MTLNIRKDKDPILRTPVEDVVNFDFELQTLIDNMIETMRKHKGIGLAAPQVGFSKNIFVCEYEGDNDSDYEAFPLTVICNPKITYKNKKQKKMVEGCLSFPGMELVIKRPESVVIKGQDRYGKPLEIKAKDLFARAIQHEYDHLNSTLLIDHLEEINVIFIGTGTLGEKALELLANDLQYKVSLVVTGETKKVVSRNKLERKNGILEIAKKHHLKTLVTSNIKDKNIIEKIRKEKPDLGIMADFGQIIPKLVLEIPKHGIINIHPSLLPKHRGPSPVTQTILNGDKLAGVSLILTSERMDAGDVVAQTAVKLSGSETGTILKNYLSEIGASLLLNSIPYYLTGDLKPTPQNEKETTYTKIIKPEDGYVDSQTKAVIVERKIRAFDNWPKVYTKIGSKRVQLLAAHFDQEKNLVLDQVKPEGKKAIAYEDFKNGYRQELTFQ